MNLLNYTFNVSFTPLIFYPFEFYQENWTTLIEEHNSDVMEWVECVNNDQLVVCYLHDVKVSPISILLCLCIQRSRFHDSLLLLTV